MDDETKAAVEWLRNRTRGHRVGMSHVPETCDVCRLAAILAHIDGEAARTQAACDRRAEEQREALGVDRWPVLIPFIAAMVRKLDANKPKKGGREGWQNDDPQRLMSRVREEVAELSHAVAVSPRVDILHEAADVANMAMMVADSVGAIRDVSIESTLTATPLGDEVKALRARVAELERSEKTLDAVCAVLGREVGNRGDSEGAVDVAERIIRERDEAVAALREMFDKGEGCAACGKAERAGCGCRYERARAVLAKYPEGR